MTNRSGEEDGPLAADRPTLTVLEVAQVLGLTGSRVHQLLNDPDKPLMGPPPPGQGRHRNRLVYADTVDRQRARQRHRRRSGRDDEATSATVPGQLQSLAGQVATLRAMVYELSIRQGGDTPDPVPQRREDQSAELRWALQQINAANDELHAALERQAEATAWLRQALEKAEEAGAAVRRSDRLRSEVIGVLLTPDDPHRLLS